MELIKIINYTLNCLLFYYVVSDFVNYVKTISAFKDIKISSEFKEVKQKIDDLNCMSNNNLNVIILRLNEIECSIKLRIDKIEQNINSHIDKKKITLFK